MINDISTAVYTCLFLLPGGIINTTIKTITPTKKYTSSQELLRWLAYSVSNGALWCWAFILMLKILDPSRLLFWWASLLLVIVSSLITGLVLGLIQSHCLVRKALKRTGLNVEHPIPTAWDFIFSTTNSPCFVIVTMDDGTKYYGYYGEESLASSDNDNRDIYIEHVYDLDNEENWIPAGNNRGVLINSSHVACIEFLEQEGEKYE